MTEPAPTEHPTASLVLDYLRVLLWPALIVWAFLAFKDDMLEILKTREVEVAGAFKIGKSIEDLSQKTQAELQALHRLVGELEAAPQDAEKVREVSASVSANIEALERNFSREVTQLRIQAVAPEVAGPAGMEKPPAAPADQARELEQLGFEHLVKRELVPALEAFQAAARLWPDYHNVTEITRLLRENRSRLTGPGDTAAAWLDIYKTLLTRFSWGMPQAVRADLKRTVDSKS